MTEPQICIFTSSLSLPPFYNSKDLTYLSHLSEPSTLLTVLLNHFSVYLFSSGKRLMLVFLRRFAADESVVQEQRYEKRAKSSNNLYCNNSSLPSIVVVASTITTPVTPTSATTAEAAAAKPTISSEPCR